MSNDNRYIGLMGLDRVKVWDREEQKFYTTHEVIKSFNFLEDKSKKYSLTVLDDAIELRDFTKKANLLKNFSIAELNVSKVILSLDNIYVVVGTWDGKILVWNIKREKLVQTIDAHNERITSLVTTSDRREVISGSSDGTVRVWNIYYKTLQQEYIGGQRGNWLIRDFEDQKVYKGDDGDFLFEKKEVYREGESMIFEVVEI